MRYSIVVPAYNSEAYIESNLMHLVANIPDMVEIIVVDDGSTDETVATVRNFIFSEKRKKIKLIEREHTCPASVRNAGWKKARGDIVIFLDSDCKVTEDWYEEMLKPFKEKGVIAVSGVYISNQKNMISKYIQEQTMFRQSRAKKFTDNLATYSLAVKKKFLEKVDGFPEDYPMASAEDTEFSYDLRKHGKFILNRKAKVYHRHSESVKKYLKKQFTHAKFRVLLYKRGNPVGDKYAGIETLAQPFLAFLSLFAFIHPAFAFFFGLLLALQMYEIRPTLDFGFFAFSVSMGVVRAYVWFIGMIWGVIEFYV